jgi:hypothetical protein
MIYKGYEISFDKKNNRYSVISNAWTLKNYSFKKDNIVSINAALKKCKKFIDKRT